MTTLTDIDTAPASGLLHIDALLKDGPQWNYLTGGDTIYYTFSTSSGKQTFDAKREPSFYGEIAGFDAVQQLHARSAIAHLSKLTGIRFAETASGEAAHLHFANADLKQRTNTALTSSEAPYSYYRDTGEIISYSPEVYIYMDNVEFAKYSGNLLPGGMGYEILLHELGHALGLKHPFSGDIVLPDSEDHTDNTLMSYTDLGGPHAEFSPYDIAALNFLYGGDGLRGALGFGPAGSGIHLTGTSRADTLNGTSANDRLQGMGGGDTINGGEGHDEALFGGQFSQYRFVAGDNGTVGVAGPDGMDWLSSIESLRFADRTISTRQVVTPLKPTAPTFDIDTNDALYLSGGNVPRFSGVADANAVVKVYNGTVLLGSTAAGPDGLWALTGPALADGRYSLHAIATDVAGTVSPSSAAAAFTVDTRAPAAPTGSYIGASAGMIRDNQAAVSGKAEAGSVVRLVDETGGTRTVIFEQTVGQSGSWGGISEPLVNGNHAVRIESVDAAGNLSVGADLLRFKVDSSLNVTGSTGRDVLSGTAANNAIDGGAGIDTVRYAVSRAGFTLDRDGNIVTVQSKGSGTDSLVNVERIRFSDASVAIDVDGGGGQVYRLYRAAFDREPDLEGLGFWISARDGGASLDSIARDFLGSGEYVQKFGASLDNQQFLSLLYKHVMHRAPDGDGYRFWLNALDDGNTTRAAVLKDFSESPENRAQVIASIQNGFEYLLWQG